MPINMANATLLYGYSLTSNTSRDGRFVTSNAFKMSGRFPFSNITSTTAPITAVILKFNFLIYIEHFCGTLSWNPFFGLYLALCYRFTNVITNIFRDFLALWSNGLGLIRWTFQSSVRIALASRSIAPRLICGQFSMGCRQILWKLRAIKSCQQNMHLSLELKEFHATK